MGSFFCLIYERKNTNKMDRIVRHISLDFQRQTSTRVVFASQHDFNSRVFLVTLYNDGVEFPLSKDVLAVMNVLRPDGEAGGYVCEIQDDGKAKYVLGSWALSVPGEALFSMSLYDGEEKKLTTGSFTVEIAPIPYTGEDISDDSEICTILDEMIDSFAHIDIGESQRQNNEEMRKENEKNRKNSEQIRVSNEQKRTEIAQKLIDGIDGLIAVQNKFINGNISVSTTLNLLDAYPVGAVYVSVSSVSPATLFGGKWERLKDRFLLGAGDIYSAGKSGGSADAVLLQHSHGVLSKSGNPVFLKEGTDESGWVLKGAETEFINVGGDSDFKLYGGGVQGTVASGTGANMPPYLTVYMWKRVS